MNYLHSCIMLNKILSSEILSSEILSSWYNFPYKCYVLRTGYTLASLANNSLPYELQHL